MASKVPDTLKKSLVAIVFAFSSFTAVKVYQDGESAPAVAPIPIEIQLAMEIGKFYESSGKHIGEPYIDKIGKGQPLTVCNGVTGKDVVAGKYYTENDCLKLELPRYEAASREAQALLIHWNSYDPFVKASFIDLIWNVGTPALQKSTAIRLANSGDLFGACKQMPRWVYGTVKGQSVKLNGLVDRRETTAEICVDWRLENILETEK